jgi:hypothetical protein
MALLRVQVSLKRTTLLPRDDVVNTFHFQPQLPGPATPADYSGVAALIPPFYNGSGSTFGKVADYLSQLLATGKKHEIKVYDMADPKPRGVRFFDTFTINPPSGTPLPAEVALCLSYQGVNATVPVKNRRGRVYIGPLVKEAVSLSQSGGDVLPNSSFQNALRDAGRVLIETDPFHWVVYSPTTLAQSTIDQCWVDNAFDTQRRRGGRPSARSQFPA